MKAASAPSGFTRLPNVADAQAVPWHSRCIHPHTRGRPAARRVPTHREVIMKRRDFITSTAAVAGAAALGAPLGAPLVARAQSQVPDVINVGHLVGICMSPLFYAHAAGYFKDEGLN